MSYCNEPVYFSEDAPIVPTNSEFRTELSTISPFIQKYTVKVVSSYDNGSSLAIVTVELLVTPLNVPLLFYTSTFLQLFSSRLRFFNRTKKEAPIPEIS